MWNFTDSRVRLCLTFFMKNKDSSPPNPSAERVYISDVLVAYSSSFFVPDFMLNKCFALATRVQP